MIEELPPGEMTRLLIVCDGGEYAFSLSQQELFGSVVRDYQWFHWAFQLQRIIQTSLDDVETQ